MESDMSAKKPPAKRKSAKAANGGDPPEPASQRSIAILVLTWLCCSRHDVRNDVATNSWNGIVERVGISAHLDAADRQHFQKAFAEGGFLAHPAAAINHFVDLGWIIPPCPDDPDVVACLNAMLGRVPRDDS